MDEPTKEKLLASIRPDMKLDRTFFLRIYGYEISYPGFADKATSNLENAGCSQAKAYYERIVAEFEKKNDEELKPIAKWLSEQIDNDFDKLCRMNKGGEEKRKQELLEQKKNLLMILQSRLQK